MFKIIFNKFAICRNDEKNQLAQVRLLGGFFSYHIWTQKDFHEKVVALLMPNLGYVRLSKG